MGGVQYRGGYLEHCGGYSVPWRYHDVRGGVGVQYRGGYHDARRDVGVSNTVGEDHKYCGKYLEYCGGVLSTVGETMSTRGGVQYRGGYSLLLFEYPHFFEHPHGTQDIPHIYHDIPYNTQYS